jgi:hypothetical protein
VRLITAPSFLYFGGLITRSSKSILTTQIYLEASESTWIEAARIYFELRRNGVMINSAVDCCIAQIALAHDALLLHRDKDFERISEIRPLRQERFMPAEGAMPVPYRGLTYQCALTLRGLVAGERSVYRKLET